MSPIPPSPLAGAYHDDDPADDSRLMDGGTQTGDPDVSLRPVSLDDFVGQRKARENLTVFITAARARSEPLDHILLAGPPGLGKTTLAQIVSREMGAGFKTTSGPILQRPGDLAAILTNLQAHDVLFIDEIHRLNPTVEEILYPAIEDFQLDLVIGEGPAARSVRIDLARFTLVGATTRTGLVSQPLRDRFGIPVRLDFYETDELEAIVTRGARLLAMPLHPTGATEIARRSRGTPRIAGRLLRRVRDFASVAGAASITAAVADDALGRLEIDQLGLDMLDRRYLSLLGRNYRGGPTGVETLAAGLSEQRDVLEDVIEPFLLRLALIQRTPRGRVLADAGWAHIGLTPPPERAGPPASLFGDTDSTE